MKAAGSVRVRVQGLSLEKLLARALEDGIALRNVERESPRAMLLNVRARDYPALQALCERVGWRMDPVAESASCRAWRMLRRRAMLSAALAVFVFVPQLAVTGLGWVAALWFAANAVFLMYDVALSRLIALLRRSLPPD